MDLTSGVIWAVSFSCVVNVGRYKGRKSAGDENRTLLVKQCDSLDTLYGCVLSPQVSQKALLWTPWAQGMFLEWQVTKYATHEEHVHVRLEPAKT